jgi:hypothetical protein
VRTFLYPWVLLRFENILRLTLSHGPPLGEPTHTGTSPTTSKPTTCACMDQEHPLRIMIKHFPTVGSIKSTVKLSPPTNSIVVGFCSTLNIILVYYSTSVAKIHTYIKCAKNMGDPCYTKNKQLNKQAIFIYQLGNIKHQILIHM